MNNPKITFGIIVLNGEPFVEYNLRSLYPFAHQIIVVEGASPAAKNIASPDGHSTDGTLEKLREFKRNEDPENKLIIVTAEDEGHPNGFWPGEKDEQSRAYAKRAAGNYLWQVDIDEFYKTEDINSIIKLLGEDPSIEMVSFNSLTFWGGIDYIVDGWYLRWGAEEFIRLFRWGPGFDYVTHRPPTVVDGDGVNLRDHHWVRGKDLAEKNIFLYHYSLLFPKQVIEKADYYSKAQWNTISPNTNIWVHKNYLQISNPFKLHRDYKFISWLNRYEGTHPHEIEKMVNEDRYLNEIQTRSIDDIEILLNKSWYTLIKKLLVLLTKPAFFFRRLGWVIRNLRKVILNKNLIGKEL